MAKKPVLAMAMLIRDEADILADNIRFHHRYGVDAFVVGDNGSTDGSRELVEKLAKELSICLIDFPADQFRQSRWMTQMVHIAAKKFKAHWVINNDADEFWLPESGNLKNHLLLSDKIVQIGRANMLRSPIGKPYFFSQWRVTSPIAYPFDYQESLGPMVLSLVQIKPKVLVSPRGLIKVKGGNHSASHLLWWASPRIEKGIRVYHFPIRSYDHFRHSIERAAKLLAKEPSTRKIGQHRRRWVKLLKAGKLKEEYDSFFFSNTESRLLERIGVIVRDEKIGAALRSLGS